MFSLLDPSATGAPRTKGFFDAVVVPRRKKPALRLKKRGQTCDEPDISSRCQISLSGNRNLSASSENLAHSTAESDSPEGAKFSEGTKLIYNELESNLCSDPRMSTSKPRYTVGNQLEYNNTKVTTERRPFGLDVRTSLGDYRSDPICMLSLETYKVNAKLGLRKSDQKPMLTVIDTGPGPNLIQKGMCPDEALKAITVDTEVVNL